MTIADTIHLTNLVSDFEGMVQAQVSFSSSSLFPRNTDNNFAHTDILSI